MSLLSGDEHNVSEQNGTTFVAECINCKRDFYVQIPFGETAQQVAQGMTCNCGNSDIVVKNSENGVVKVENG